MRHEATTATSSFLLFPPIKVFEERERTTLHSDKGCEEIKLDTVQTEWTIFKISI